jgi:hypothetical protein
MTPRRHKQVPYGRTGIRRSCEGGMVREHPRPSMHAAPLKPRTPRLTARPRTEKP